MSHKRYPAITVVGGERISALYGVDNGIVDWQGVGIQHFFHRNYEMDLVHSGVTFFRHDSGHVEWGNRLSNGKRHPEHQHPIHTRTLDGFRFQTTFRSQENQALSWTEEVMASPDNKLLVETHIANDGPNSIVLDIGTYVILRNPGGGQLRKTDNGALWQGAASALQIAMEGAEDYSLTVESPTGFVYRTLQQLLQREASTEPVASRNMLGVALWRTIEIPPQGSVVLHWGIAAGENREEVDTPWEWEKERSAAIRYWREWTEHAVGNFVSLPARVRDHYLTNLAAIKGALLGGFVPADITGHYFSNGSPSYYARDAMMIARAFLLSGYHQEAESILTYLIGRPTKQNSGEFFQRYNGKGESSEGANNNVPHQLDSQGYMLRNLQTYYERTGKWLLSLEQVKPYVEILFSNQGPHGLIGPEGGVNEGVFGPAYIISSNMFIYGGVMAAAQMAELQGDPQLAARWTRLAESIDRGIQSAWIEDEGRYGYGYVEYAEEVVKKYDTPQYFGPLYGYPISPRIRLNNEFMLEHATFFGDGIGYTEQEYHHGPWLFNTGACAEYQALTGDAEQYVKKVEWMMDHANGYGLMPEAVDAEDENRSFINPLTWACAEFVSTISILATDNGFRPGRLAVADQVWKDDDHDHSGKAVGGSSKTTAEPV